MNAPPLPPDARARLARQSREHFVAKAQTAMVPLVQALRSRLSELVESSPSTREMHERRDALLAFEKAGAGWAQGTVKAWQKALVPPTATARVRLESASLELIGDDVVEQKILSSRLALAIGEKATWELNDLRLRMQYLEGGDELPSTDVLRPEALAQMLVEQWSAAGLERETWRLVQDVIHKHVVEQVSAAYKLTNEFLVNQDVMRDIDLSARVRRGVSAPVGRPQDKPEQRPAASEPPADGRAGPSGGAEGGQWGGGGPGSYGGGFAQGGAAAGGYAGGGGSGGYAGAGGYGPAGQGGPAGYGGAGGHGGYDRQGAAASGEGSGAGGEYGWGGGPGQAGTGYGPAGQPPGGSWGGPGGGAVAGQGPSADGAYGGGYGGPHSGGNGGGGGAGYGGGLGGPGAGGQPGGGHAGRHADGQGAAGLGVSEGGAAPGGYAGGGYGAGYGGRFAGGQGAAGSEGPGGRAGVHGGGNGYAAGAPDSIPAGGMRSVPGAVGRGGVADETRMMTSSPPLARARARATGVLGQLRRLLSERVVGFDTAAPPTRPSPALAQALSDQVTQAQSTQLPVGSTAQDIVIYDDAAVQQVAVDLRRRSGELKKKAETSNEKATIEIVALMFQSILAEERIPPAIRVWFARLQMPVLRVAISEPEFFGTLEHPARQLIDRMGSCVMGFDATAIGGTALEVEIKRVVQVIEQYPETGRRVFQLVYDEFQKFLSRFLTDSAPTQRMVSVAQQVEQKETLAVQYTIELRSMLADLPVRDEIREFLFKVWTDVLALSAVKNGPQHEETLSLKASASDLVWAASAKPNRNERAKVIQDLPKLLQRLRHGMTMVGIEGKAQESHIKVIGDTLADAFLSKTQAIPQEQIDAMAKRLAHLEDFVSDDPSTDLPLNAESIELMLGIDASNLEVVADGGSRPTSAMLAWAAELQLGNWFTLDHNGSSNQVQYVWRSDRGQLHLFASPGGRSYLVQARRLAAYLQAGLLLPAEEEALTVRATRDALAKLDANPERLLQ